MDMDLEKIVDANMRLFITRLQAFRKAIKKHPFGTLPDDIESKVDVTIMAAENLSEDVQALLDEIENSGGSKP